MASHLKKPSVAVAAVLAGGALLLSLDGQAREGAPSASDPCAGASGWNLACLRQTYAQPIAGWPRPQVAEGVTPQEMAPVSAMPVSGPRTRKKLSTFRRYAGISVDSSRRAVHGRL